MLDLPPGLGFERQSQRPKKLQRSRITAGDTPQDSEAPALQPPSEQLGDPAQHNERKPSNKGRRKQKPGRSASSPLVALGSGIAGSEETPELAGTEATRTDAQVATLPARTRKQSSLGEAVDAKPDEVVCPERRVSSVSKRRPKVRSAKAKGRQPNTRELEEQQGAPLMDPAGAAGVSHQEPQGWIDEAVLNAIARPQGSSTHPQPGVPETPGVPGTHGLPGLFSQTQAQAGTSPVSSDARGRKPRGRTGQGGNIQGNIVPMRRSSLDKSQGSPACSRQPFTRHWSGKELQQALKRGAVFRCAFRVNAADRRQGFAGLDGLPCDIAVQGLNNQNRAIAGDEVAVRILPPSEWLSQRVLSVPRNCQAPDATSEAEQLRVLEEKMALLAGPPATDNSEPWLHAGTPEESLRLLAERLDERPNLRATGRVVAILEKSPRRGKVVGVLKEEDDKLLLLPIDPRMPRGIVRREELAADLKATLQAEKEGDGDSQTLVSAMIDSWQENSFSPAIKIRESIGQAGEIEVETKAFLEMEGVDTDEFGPDVLACLPSTPWHISEEEVAKRRDLRALRLFSIDPPSARDLDDALSVEALPGGSFRVGVHIADVSHFIPPGSALDAKAALRATSVYLVQRVIPMLPPLLCEQLCSLNPGVDRLAFSIIWDLSPQGDVLSQWTGRTVIRSCARLAYPHAQAMVDGKYAAREGEEPPVKLEAPHTWPQVVADVKALNGIARHLHRRRFESGALRLDNVKLSFQVDEHGNPKDSHIYEQQEANELVAEFMLLANMSVAQLIGRAFPENAMLRRHPAPDDRKMSELEQAAQRLGYEVDTTTAGTIQESLKRLRQAGEDPLILDILQLMATKPMKQAQYFSTGSIAERGDWRHYALAVPMYTHFTSPIRRYPDVIVHRLLAALLEQDPTAGTEVMVAYGREDAPPRMAGARSEPGSSTPNRTQAAGEAALAEVLAEGQLEELEGFCDESTPASLGTAGEEAEECGIALPLALDQQEAPVFDTIAGRRQSAAEGRRRQGSPVGPGRESLEEETWTGSSSSGGSMRSAASEDEQEDKVVQDQEDAQQPHSFLQEAMEADARVAPPVLPHAPGTASAVPSLTALQDLNLDKHEAGCSEDQAKGVGKATDNDSCEAGAGKAPRNLARKWGEGKRKKAIDRRREHGARSSGSKGQPRAKEGGGSIPVSSEMLTSGELEKVAKHCNERKIAAKSCSDSSSRLYLCVLLRTRPTVVEAVVVNINGNRFFDIYVPMLGLESRVQVSDILPNAEGRWDPEQRSLKLQRKPGQQEALPGSSAPCLADLANADQLHNPGGLQPVSLPLDVRAFTKFPVVLSAKSPGNAKPLSTFTMLFLTA